tara:strand:- start:7462 stop:7968 length:507 start_codon:yes stop_codon:yes gene_type:complete
MGSGAHHAREGNLNMEVHYSSKDTTWRTPKRLYDRLNREFGFELDAAASKQNALCDRYYTEEDDALNLSWESPGAVWLNPPYGRVIGKWMEKAVCEANKGSRIVSLVPARTDTLWWHESAMKASEVRLVKGRVRFVGASHGAPFPSAILVFDRSTRDGLTPRFSSFIY